MTGRAARGYGVDAALAAPVFRLVDQYRMHPAICAAVSRAFYGGALWTPQAVAAAQLEAPLHFVDFGRGHAVTRDGASLS